MKLQLKTDVAWLYRLNSKVIFAYILICRGDERWKERPDK